MLIYAGRINEVFGADELSEFLITMDECDKEVECDDGAYSVHTSTGTMLAYFSETPESGPPGGWARFALSTEV